MVYQAQYNSGNVLADAIGKSFDSAFDMYKKQEELRRAEVRGDKNQVAQTHLAALEPILQYGAMAFDPNSSFGPERAAANRATLHQTMLALQAASHGQMSDEARNAMEQHYLTLPSGGKSVESAWAALGTYPGSEAPANNPTQVATTEAAAPVAPGTPVPRAEAPTMQTPEQKGPDFLKPVPGNVSKQGAPASTGYFIPMIGTTLNGPRQIGFQLTKPLQTLLESGGVKPRSYFSSEAEAQAYLNGVAQNVPGAADALGRYDSWVKNSGQTAGYQIPVPAWNLARVGGMAHANGTPNSPRTLAQHEVATGDVHVPMLVGLKEGIVNERAMRQPGVAETVAQLNMQYPTNVATSPQIRAGGLPGPQDIQGPTVQAQVAAQGPDPKNRLAALSKVIGMPPSNPQLDAKIAATVARANHVAAGPSGVVDPKTPAGIARIEAGAKVLAAGVKAAQASDLSGIAWERQAVANMRRMLKDASDEELAYVFGKDVADARNNAGNRGLRGREIDMELSRIAASLKVGADLAQTAALKFLGDNMTPIAVAAVNAAKGNTRQALADIKAEFPALSKTIDALTPMVSGRLGIGSVEPGATGKFLMFGGNTRPATPEEAAKQNADTTMAQMQSIYGGLSSPAPGVQGTMKQPPTAPTPASSTGALLLRTIESKKAVRR